MNPRVRFRDELNFASLAFPRIRVAPHRHRQPPRIRGFAVGLFVALFIGSSALAASPSLSIADRQPLVVGVTADSYPYGFVDSDGKWTGYSADLLDAVARTMDLKIRRVAAPSAELHQRFESGEFDLLQAFSQTPDREPFTDFSVPYLTLQGALFVRPGNRTIRKLSDLNGRRLAMIGVGSIAEKFLRDHHLEPQRVPVRSVEEGLRAVETGDCAAVFISQLSAASLIRQKGLRNVQMFGRPLEGYNIRHCFAVHRGDAELLARLNEGLAILNRNGEYQKIYDKWFGGLTPGSFTREQVISYVAGALALAFLAALWGLVRQRALRKRIATQAAELVGKETLLQALYDNIPLAIGVIEAATDGYPVLAINRQAEPYFGTTAQLAVGKYLDALPLDQEWADQLRGVLRRWPADGTLVREERTLLSSRRQLVFTLVPLAPSRGGSKRVCVLVEDISERRQLDEELAQGRKLRAVGELVGGIAHEFNNLLTPVFLKVGEIQADWAQDVHLQHELKVIRQAAQRAAELTRRLLTFGRKSESVPESVRLESAVQSAFALLRQTVDRRITWENRVSPELPPLYLNATDLNQILLNLLINARDTLMDKLAVRPSGWEPRISVEAISLPANAVNRVSGRNERAPLGWQRVTVRDNGLGMATAVRERIFEPFFTTKEIGKGTGLGLATVWHLVHEFGGTVELESTADVGSTFHVFLPVWPVPARTPVVTSASEHPPEPSTRVLVVEDDEPVARVTCAAVRRAGHQVVHYADGDGAWAHVQSHWRDYGLMVFDVNMPGITGIELANRVRGAGYTNPLIIVSGRLTSVDFEGIREAGADRVLAKPFTMDEFRSAMRECLTGAANR